MQLSSGTRLGPYEILSPLGAGGMGEVYRARDTRLDRTVAIKVLPPQAAARPDLRERFEREARTVSSLNHPHICTLHDIGQQDGVDYLVMEYLEGETLAARLAKGPLPLEQTLRFAVQMADALDKAHRQGVIHRDLKPGNIIITKTGAKLLDFGLAKLLAPETPGAIPGSSAMMTQRADLTAEGTLLGTLQYMAPEQLEGREADARSDIFAFGAVLYEMATGQRACEGKSQASLIGAILHKEPPPISSLQPMTPPALDRIVRACLAKEADDRWHTSHDVMLQLAALTEGGTQAAAPLPAAVRRRGREALAWSVAAVAVAAAALSWILPPLLRAPDPARVIRFFVDPPENTTFINPIALSPDGRRLAFAAQITGGKRQLWVRPLDALKAQALPGTDDASQPFWSPDSRFIAFFAQGKLKKIDSGGGPPQTLCEAADPRGGAWSAEGTIIFTPGTREPLYRVSAAGGSTSPLTTLDKEHGEISHRWPGFLPDGRHFLYLGWANQPDHRAILLGNLGGKEMMRILSSTQRAAFARPGHILFAREGTLMAQQFDPDRLQLTSDAYPVAEDVQHLSATGQVSFSTSDNGVLAYGTGGPPNTLLTWLDRKGAQIGTIEPPGPYLRPTLSPDGKRVAVDRWDLQAGSIDVWLLDLSRGTSSRFTFDPGFDSVPVWSPDGTKVLFSSSRAGSSDLFQKVSSGAGQEQEILKTDTPKFATDWSRDGRFIVFSNEDPKTRRDLWILPVSGDRKPYPYLQTEFSEGQAQFSPDGRYMAYISNESGQYEVYVQTFPSSGAKWQISTQGGLQPIWRRDGKEMFYIAPDQKLMAVAVDTGAAFTAGVPQALFQTRVVYSTGNKQEYSVTEDGQRFLLNNAVEETVPNPVAIVINWLPAPAR